MSDTCHYMTLIRVRYDATHIKKAKQRFDLLPTMIAAAQRKGNWSRVSDLIIERQTLRNRHGFKEAVDTIQT